MSDAELSELVELLRALIRIRSVNPPGDEILAARYLEQVLADEGLRPTVVEPFPGRGSIVARVRGDGTGGDPLLLLSHLDVVPAEPAGWTHDPFGGDLVDGYVWGRGAIDMKGMVAMEVQVMRRLARAAREAGRDPAADPIPGLRRDVIFCSSADEEAGGWHGANWLVNEHPDWLRAAGALNEAGGIAMTVRRRPLLPDPGGGEGLRRLQDPRQGPLGPRLDPDPGQRRGPGRSDRDAAGRARAGAPDRADRASRWRGPSRT